MIAGSASRADDRNSPMKSGHCDADCVIKIENLQKRYGKTDALKGVDLAVQKGELFALIGPDGAGKTTIFQILSGVMRPTSGRATILGRPPEHMRAKMGYLTQHFSLYPELTIDENLRYAAGVRNVPSKVFAERRENLLSRMALLKFGDRLAGLLSGGMKTKLALCCALIAQPEVLLLDEPTTGVDPVSRRELWQLLASIAQEGVTTIVATPNLDEAEVSSKVGLIYDGRIHKTGSPAELRNALELSRLEVQCGWLEAAEDEFENAHLPSIVDVQARGDRLDILVRDVNQAKSEIESLLLRANLAPYTVVDTDLTLENVFAVNLASHVIQHQAPVTVFREAQEQDLNRFAIKTENLKKNFGSFQAVKSISLEIRYGEIYGLLGANGAGKTTTIQMLCGLQKPASGTASVAGISPLQHTSKTRQKIGYMSQKFTLYDDLTVLENLEFYAATYEIPGKIRREKIDWVLAVCGLSGMEKTLTGQLPRGWKQRIAFGASVIHEPEILFLDEPTAGLDPFGRRQLWKLIREFAANGTAVLVTTHFLDEAEYCHRLGLMLSGTLLAQGSPTALKRDQPGKLIEIFTSGQILLAFHVLSAKLEPWRIAIFPKSLKVLLDRADDESSLKTILQSAGLQDIRLREVAPSLEEVFIGMVQGGKA